MEFGEIGSTFVVVLLAIFALVGLLTVIALIIVIVRFRPPLSAIAAVVGALIYGASPIDLVPEVLLGPIGALDDIGVLAAAIGFMVTQLRKRRGVDATGAVGDRSPGTRTRPPAAGGGSGATRLAPPAGPTGPRLSKDT